MNVFICKLIILSVLASCGQVNSNTKVNQTSTAADTCDDPDANINCSFINMPSNLNNVMTIAGKDENGEKLVVSGTIFKADGKTPYPGVLLYAYHTDSKGYYSKSGKETGAQKWHGRLHGWCKTDAKGYYEIRSIRPAPYPSNTMPAHIHIAVKEPGNKEPYYISDIVFKDDKLVNEQYLKSIQSMVGGTGVVNVTKSQSGIWVGKRDILLTK
jgi:protocatechuate 3,4-dioxygenase, beta subunit